MRRVLTILALPALVLACGLAVDAQQGGRRFVPVTDAMLQKPDPADWLMWRRTLDGWGYSPLDQINRSNVAQLQDGLDARHRRRAAPRRRRRSSTTA